MPSVHDPDRVEIPRLAIKQWAGEPALVYRPDADVTAALDPAIAAFLATAGPATLPYAELHADLTAHLGMRDEDPVKIDVLIDELSTRHLLTLLGREASGNRPEEAP